MSIVQGTLPVGSLDHAITLNVQSSGGSHFETVTDTTPYLHRASPQDVANMMKLKKVVGGTIAWNQIGGRTKFPNTHGENGISISWTDAETVSISGTASSVSWIYVEIPSPYISANNHVYIALTDNMPSDVRFGILQGDGVYNYCADGVKQLLFKNTARIRAINFRHPASIAYNYTCHPQLFDLTQMFGSTIADYIYSLEQGSAGDGVAWFKALFGEDYYSYNAGELMSVQTSAHKTVGFNQWDEEWELGGINDSTGEPVSSSLQIRSKNFIPTVGNTEYYFRIPNGNGVVYFYDADYTFISKSSLGNATFTTPTNCAYMKFRGGQAYGTTYNNDICINLSSSRNGEYEPYEEHTYPLDDNLTLRGIPKLDSNNELYYDGDTYASDGTVTRKYGIVTFDGSSDETWARNQALGYDGYRFYITNALIGAKLPNTGKRGFVLANHGVYADGHAVGIIFLYNNYGSGQLFFYPSTNITEVADLKTWLGSNNLTVVYELATPTTESADAYTQSQRVGATEEFVDGRTVEIPVGNVSEYKRLIQED